MEACSKNIPRYFCWTRFGTEAAQSVQQIFARKEKERVDGNGIFLWGIGNPVGPSITKLVRVCDNPKVFFSSIKSPPRSQDVSPPAVAVWASARTLDGRPFEVPERAVVTSRYDPDVPKRAHYALVCYSERPLDLSPTGDQIWFGALRNIITGRPVGPSQVTAVVEHHERHEHGSCALYDVAAEAQLVPPYFVRLEDPFVVHRRNGSKSRELGPLALRHEILRRRNRSPDQQRIPMLPA